MDIDHVIYMFNTGSFRERNKIGIVCETEEESVELLSLIERKAKDYAFGKDLLIKHIKRVGLPVIFFGYGSVGPYEAGERQGLSEIEYFKNIKYNKYQIELI